MITKSELIDRLRKLRHEGEGTISLLSSHLNDIPSFSQVKPEAQEEIRSIILTLIRESEEHTALLEEAVEKVKEAGQDAY